MISAGRTMWASVALGALLAASTAADADETVIPQSALVASTSYYTNNLGTGTLDRNDDLSTPAVSLGFNVTFEGHTYDSLYINNNGNVTFTQPVSSYIPSGPEGTNVPVISAWFGDVDTRNLASGIVHFDLDSADQQLVVTWDNVGYFNSHADALDSFQLVLRGDTAVIPVGEGSIGFFYKDMGWENTDTSHVAAVGFGDGMGNGEVLQGSSSQTNLNTVVADHHIWFDQNLVVVPPPPSGVPEPASWAMMISGFGLVGGALRRRSATGAAIA